HLVVGYLRPDAQRFQALGAIAVDQERVRRHDCEPRTAALGDGGFEHEDGGRVGENIAAGRRSN
ncbi:MAG: hypothetical protein ABI877_23805, partial [Gemmatimonadaceae bacterium]